MRFIEPITLTGQNWVTMEPLERRHEPELLEAAKEGSTSRCDIAYKVGANLRGAAPAQPSVEVIPFDDHGDVCGRHVPAGDARERSAEIPVQSSLELYTHSRATELQVGLQERGQCEGGEPASQNRPTGGQLQSRRFVDNLQGV